MVKPDERAFPVPDANYENGISTRTYIATAVLSGIASHAVAWDKDFMVQEAVKITDLLIKELNK